MVVINVYYFVYYFFRFFPNVYHICMLDSIDDKNIDFRIKNIKNMFFFTFIKNIKKTCIKTLKLEE